MRWWRWRRVQDADVVVQLDPWLLACAVGAFNGSIYYGSGRNPLYFAAWINLVDLDDALRVTGLSMKKLRAVLMRYAIANCNKHMIDVLTDEHRRHGLLPPQISGGYFKATVNKPELRRGDAVN
jgi:hypothetical protein